MRKYIKHLQLGEIQQAVKIISWAMRNFLQQWLISKMPTPNEMEGFREVELFFSCLKIISMESSYSFRL